MSDEISDPLTALAEAAAGMHEWFTSLLAAGFTELQALTLMALTIRPTTQGDS